MKRRDFITLLGAAAVWPLAAYAQQPAMPVIGYLSARSAQSDVSMTAAFRQGLGESGYIEGQNVAIEYRWGGGQFDRVPTLVADLVRRQVAVIVTMGGEQVALAAKSATATVPIVFLGAGDPVQVGLVASLNRPGENVTGVTMLLYELTAKQLGLLRELVPTAAKYAILADPNVRAAESQIGDAQAAARAMGQQLSVHRASTEVAIDTAFTALLKEQADALLIVASPFFVVHANRIVGLAARNRLPTIYFRRELADAGGLISYGSNTTEAYRQAGVYTGRILKGAKPAELPVVQSAKFELVINLKTAKALGLEIPSTLLARADEVIE